MIICRHREGLKKLQELQRLEKRLRDLCNRKKRKPCRLLSELNYSIRYRNLFLWQALYRCELSRAVTCGFCSLIGQLRDGHSWYDRSCLASSTVERLLRKQGVEGSNPSRGSKIRT